MLFILHEKQTIRFLFKKVKIQRAESSKLFHILWCAHKESSVEDANKEPFHHLLTKPQLVCCNGTNTMNQYIKQLGYRNNFYILLRDSQYLALTVCCIRET